MKYLLPMFWGRLLRWSHGISALVLLDFRHRAITINTKGWPCDPRRTILVGCECGKLFWYHPKAYGDRLQCPPSKSAKSNG